MQKLVFPPNFTSIACGNYITGGGVKNIAFCEFGLKVFTQTTGNCLFEYIPSILIFHTLTPPGLRYYSTYNTYLGRNNNNTMKIYVPDSAVDTYKAAWSVHASRIYPLSEYEGQTYY